MFIYKIYSDNSNKIYVGRTIQELRKRFSSHKSREMAKCASSWKVFADGCCHIEQLEICDDANGKQAEAKFIKLYNDDPTVECVNVKLEKPYDRKQYTKEYHAKKVTCECGQVLRYDGMRRHKVTNGHLQKMADKRRKARKLNKVATN
jgi:hypothetical protein